MKEDILKLRAQGKTYNQIKEILGCSKSTISYHCGIGQKQKTEIRNIRNRASRLSSCTTNRRFMREFTRKYKAIHGCRECGNKDFRVLDFDHIDASKKEFGICQLWKYSSSLELLKNEIRKCQILCANCHRIKTYEERKDMQR